MQAAKLLFDQPDSAEPSLFGKPTELAAFLVEHGLYKGHVAGISSFLSQIIQRGERSCPDRLMIAVCDAVRLKVKDKPEDEREQYAERVRRALEVDDLVRRTAQPLSAESLYFELQATAETAAEHFIITARPAERVVSDRANMLRGILLHRLGLATLIEDGGASRRRQAEPETRYTFCLPGEDAAKRFWWALLQEIRSAAQAAKRPFDQRRVQKALQALHECEALRVFAVPPYLCGCPVAVFDPNTADPSAFVFFYHLGGPAGRTDLVSVARMDATDLQIWKELVHGPLEIGQIERKSVEYPG